MLDIIAELERNGASLQHFAREMSRFFRNLLVIKIAGVGTRLVAASAAERERMGEVAARFSEEDLTRYLQISLDVFADLQTSLQPRLHLELGLIKMVHAGRLESLEKAIARIGSGGGGTAPAAPPAPKAAPVAPKATPTRTASPPAAATAVKAVAAPAAAPASGDLRSRLLTTLNENRMTFIADAVEHAELIEKSGELEFRCPKAHMMALRSGDLSKMVERVAGRPLKITVTVADVAATAPSKATAPQGDDNTRVALDNPEVQRYRELFPGSEVRAVRNLKE
jgi:DNA polymerase-3 subunit gamma/tau